VRVTEHITDFVGFAHGDLRLLPKDSSYVCIVANRDSPNHNAPTNGSVRETFTAEWYLAGPVRAGPKVELRTITFALRPLQFQSDGRDGALESGQRCEQLGRWAYKETIIHIKACRTSNGRKFFIYFANCWVQSRAEACTG
jgi:hypothetical protein